MNSLATTLSQLFAINAVVAFMALTSCGDVTESATAAAEPIRGASQSTAESPSRTVASQVLTGAAEDAVSTAANTDALSRFRTPSDDHLPTTSQLEQGADSSIGNTQRAPSAASRLESAPSTSAKPPASR